MKNRIAPLTFNLLPFTFLFACCLRLTAHAQSEVYDKAVVHQEQRMVFLQWDQNKFDPQSGFLGLNPYYWLVWGFFYPNYHKTDLRPLSATGPQTQRLALVAAQNSIDGRYKLQSDTVRNTALSQIAATSGLLSDADPLWLLYYRQQFQPLLNYSAISLLGPLPTSVSAKLVAEGTYNWYSNELAMLKERLNGARSADMDRGSRIMAYYRMLKEYQRLSGVWNVRIAAAQTDLQMAARQQRLKTGSSDPGVWTPQTDVQIANKVISNAKY